MLIRPLQIADAFEVQLEARQDVRGYFMRSYDSGIFARHDLKDSWVQENEAFSIQKGIIRGLHFQKPPYAETKFVRVARGAILDVFVDIRRSSPSFRKWEMIELSETNHRAVYIPKGCAHGYCTLTDSSVVLYKVDQFYAPQFEGGLRWNDSELAIPWPATEPIISTKDSVLPVLRDFVSPFD
jgi:dTDP-4-dehydrorhamnose 3,5-epimerase